jgi:hypothetical protein
VQIRRSHICPACVSKEVPPHRTAGSRAGTEQIQESGDRESGAMKEKLKRIRGSGNIFLDLGFDKAEAIGG